MENLSEMCDSEYRQAWDDATLEAGHWAALSDITPINAAILLCRLNPNEQSYDAAKLITTDETKPEHLVRLVQRLTDLAGTAPKPRSLRNWHQTAIAMGLTYHSWIDGYMDATTAIAQQDNTATPAPVVAESASDGDKPWKEKAIARAYEIIKRDGAKDLYPSQMDTADEIAKQFRQDGLNGAEGKPLTGAYIKRHALNGISSAQSKLASTVTRRGK